MNVCVFLHAEPLISVLHKNLCFSYECKCDGLPHSISRCLIQEHKVARSNDSLCTRANVELVLTD